MPDDPKTKASSPRSDEANPAAPAAADAPDDAPEAEDPETGAAAEGETPLDPASPEAILKRVSAFGEEDALERIARIEEAKLAARRSKDKKTKKKGGLEAAASKRLAKIGEKAQPKKPAIVIPDADPLLDRALKFSKWAKKNKPLVRNVSIGAVVAAAAILGYVGYERHHEAEASVQLAKAVADERGEDRRPGRGGGRRQAAGSRPRLQDDRGEARGRAAGLPERRDEVPRDGRGHPGEAVGGGALARQGGRGRRARGVRRRVGLALAKADAEVRGRALEGMGFAYGSRPTRRPETPPRGCSTRRRRSTARSRTPTSPASTNLGMYHQARVLQREGDKTQAIDILKKLHERLHRPGDEHKFVYLEIVADDALRALAPDALPPRSAGPGGAPGMRGGKPQYTQEQIKKMLEQMQKSGGKPAPGAPPPGTPK